MIYIKEKVNKRKLTLIQTKRVNIFSAINVNMYIKKTHV